MEIRFTATIKQQPINTIKHKKKMLKVSRPISCPHLRSLGG